MRARVRVRECMCVLLRETMIVRICIQEDRCRQLLGVTAVVYLVRSCHLSLRGGLKGPFFLQTMTTRSRGAGIRRDGLLPFYIDKQRGGVATGAGGLEKAFFLFLCVMKQKQKQRNRKENGWLLR